jgi:putative flippase GtrA
LAFGNILTNSYIVLFVGKIIATCVTLVWNYLLYRRFVFVTKD